MPESVPPLPPTGPGASPPSSPSPARPAAQPWRTEGLPPTPPKKPINKWLRIGIWPVGYLLLFGMLTLQDRLSGPQAVPYTEFKNQVAAKNVAELFARGDSIEGELRKAAPRRASRSAPISSSRPNGRRSPATICWPS